MIKQHESIIIQVTSSAMVPFIQLFALYVLFHGHYGPGGGFQGGVILAVSIVLMRLYMGREMAHAKFPPKMSLALAATGLLVFMLTGLVPMVAGGAFLDYGNLMIPGLSASSLRHVGILIVEIGISMTVFGTMVLVFDNLSGENW